MNDIRVSELTDEELAELMHEIADEVEARLVYGPPGGLTKGAEKYEFYPRLQSGRALQ